MKTEMGYKFKGSGFEAPEEKRKYEKPDDKLAAVLEEWLAATNRMNSDKTLYSSAVKLIKPLKPSITDAHALLLRHQDHPRFNHLGLFTSAIYNQSPDEVIVYDLGIKAFHIGHLLKKNKILINKTDLSYGFGIRANGTIVNLGTAYGGIEGACQKAHGTCINYGQIDGSFGAESKGAILNYGNTKHLGNHSKGLIANLGKTESSGEYSTGPILNFGAVENHLGGKAKGPVVNAGVGGFNVAHDATGIVISTRTPTSYGDLDMARAVARYDYSGRQSFAPMKQKMQIIEKRIEQIRALFEKGRNDYRKAIETLKELGSPEKISTDLEELVRKANGA